MADVEWIKITTNMFEDEKIDFIESMPEADAILVIWIKLLTLAGKCNDRGYIFLTEKMPYSEEMLAHKFRKPINVVKLAISTLVNLDMVEIDQQGFINIINWSKHQNIEGLEKIRQQTRKRVADYRERQKLLLNGNVTCNEESNVTVTEGNAIEEEQEKDLEQDIDIEQQQTVSCCSDKNSFEIIFKEFELQGFSIIDKDYVNKTLLKLMGSYTEEWIINSFKVAAKANKRNLNYVEGVLRNWKVQGSMKLPPEMASQPTKKNRFHNFEQRTDKYSKDELEAIAKKKRQEHMDKLKGESVNA